MILQFQIFSKFQSIGIANNCHNFSYLVHEWEQSNRTTYDKQYRRCRRHTLIVIEIHNSHNS